MSEAQAIVPPHLTVRVICDHDHILSGLFIVFKLKPRADGGAWDDVARVMEGTADPGEKPADPASAAAAKKHKPPTKKQLEAHEVAVSKWKAQLDASLDLPPDPSDRFVAGFVDDDGFLAPVHADSNPWFDAATRRDPDTYKLGLGEIYEACLIRHPDPELARAVARHLNGEATSEDAKYGIASWGTLLRDITVEKISTESGDQYAFKLSEDPSHFVPPGPARYAGWNLYLDMPHAMCASVPDQIEKLQVDLARFRYPTGEQQPFTFRGAKQAKLLKGFLVSRSLAQRVKYAKAKAAQPKLKLADAKYMHEKIFRMHNQVVAAVGGFQEDLLGRRAFALADKDAAFRGGNSWAYVLGSPFIFEEGSTDPRAWQLPAYLYLGVVEQFTASMFEHWETQGLRKPGSVMVQTQRTAWRLWLQERAAVAVDAWALVLETCGVKYTASALHGGSSFRRLVDEPWPGSTKASLHNSGLAVDFAGGGRRCSLPLWPIRFEADWVRKSARDMPKAGADPGVVDRGNLEYTLYFKLYAHSELDVFGSVRALSAFAALRMNLEALAAPDGSGKLHDTFKRLFAGLDGAAADAYLRTALAGAVAYVRGLLAKSNDELKAELFRDRVHQFLANAYEADAGTSMAAHRPHEGGGDFAAVPWAKSWVNVSAIGYELGMERISAHQNDVRDQTFLWGAKAVPVTYSMLRYMDKTYMDKTRANSDLVSLLHDMSAPPAEAPENVHYTRPILLRAGPKLPVLMEVRPADLDRKFLMAWREKVTRLPKEFQPSLRATRGSAVATGAQLRVVLSAAPGKDADILKAADMLAGFGKKRFVVTHAGELTVKYTPPGKLLTGAEVAAGIKFALAMFQADVISRWVIEDNAAASAPADAKPKRTREQVKKDKEKARAKEIARAAPDWTLVIQPVFVTGTVDVANLPFLPTHFVTVPKSSSPGHLEWWHYQHRQTGNNWGDAVAECGYSRTILGSPREGMPEAAPVIHRGAGFVGKLQKRVGTINRGRPGNTHATPSGG